MTPQRLIAIIAMLSAFPVSADELVDRADANGDGYVSLYELRAAYYADMEFNRRIEQSFADYDTDGDGLISEAERRAQAAARARTAPGTGIAASGETAAVTPVTGTAPVPAAGTAAIPASATQATAAAEVSPTPATGLSADAGAETASMPAGETVSGEIPAVDAVADTPGDRSPETAPAATTADETLADARGLSRSEQWIQQIDADNSGGASLRELAASGDGKRWLQASDFASADKNSDGDLDPDELEVLIQSMERRQRR
jgi:hypothetical protein